jgi:hypothetical protein
VTWATDVESENSLMQWSRATGKVTRLDNLFAQSLYAEQIEADLSLISSNNWDAALYELGDGGLRAVARFTPREVPGWPLPGVRLARGRGLGGNWLYFNPLRTVEEEAAIYRISREEAGTCRPEVR